MKRASLRRDGKAVLELVEEATHLLRSARPSVLAGYYLGTVPFVLGFLFFWTEMSRSPLAYEHLAGGSLGVAALFAWMKFRQAVFARSLAAALIGAPPPRWGVAGSLRLFMTQTALQATGLFLVPLAAVLTLPFGWVYAFYQNLACLDSGDAEAGSLARKAMRQAAQWPAQNHWLLATLFGFGLCIFVNWASVGFVLPHLLHSLFGIESIFTRSSLSLLNSTFFATIAGLTYLSLDPLVKAAYVLRCFYGEAVRSGEDLRCELNQCQGGLPEGGKALSRQAPAGVPRTALTRQNPLARTATSALLVGVLAIACDLRAAETRSATSRPPSPATEAASGSGTLSAQELDQAIGKVIQQRKYTWRLPREAQVQTDDGHKSFLERYLDRVKAFVEKTAKAFGGWLDRLLRKLFGSGRTRSSPGSGYGWIMAQEILLYGLIAAAAVALGFLIFRVVRDRQQRRTLLAAEPIQPVPELADESVSADQLPEDGWTMLARELLGRGELRLALRALYFSSLAHLAGRNFIGLAKFKSNRDYERELERRAHAFPGLRARFGENVAVFDRAWYGLHQVDDEIVTRFAANVERIRSEA